MERYYSLNAYGRDHYGAKLLKLSLDGGFSCPNRDGTLSSQGCIFCSERGAGDFSRGYLSIKDQVAQGKARLEKKWGVGVYVGYFQNFTNTYGEIGHLRSLYEEVLQDPQIKVLAIATRADCLGQEVLELLEELSQRVDIWLEIGMQSVKEETISLVNRGYSHSSLEKKSRELKERGLPFLLHVIFGLPGETREDMMASIDYVNQSGAFGVKIHSLYIQNDAPLYRVYQERPFPLLDKDTYTDLVVEALGRLREDLVVHRITGDGDKKKLVGPLWTADKLSVIGEINKKLKERGIRQGSLLK